ncbi:1,4-dihydroxy-2-naphthoyl-CoA synthase [compost metagenome]
MIMAATTMAENSLVLLERRDGVALLRLNRPQRHNSLVPALLEALLGALDEIEADTSVRAVVLTHAGRNFSTGGDVAAFAAPDAVTHGQASALSAPGAAEAEAIALARGVADKVPGSVAHTRALLRWDTEALAAGLERERAAFVAQIASAETADGMRRFLAGRMRE